MDIKTLESFRLSDAISFHDELNPNLWIDDELRPEVKKQLELITDDFIDELGINGLDVVDVTVSGSNAAYSYTPHSDLDLHIVVDMSNMPNDEVYRELFNAKKNLYKESHDIKIHGVPIEVYVQDSSEPVVSLGEYSIKNNRWLKLPTKRRANFDQTITKQKYNDLSSIVQKTLKSKDLDKVNKVLKKIKQYRQAGLDKGGEFSPENLAYKVLRTQGMIDKLYHLRDKLHSVDLSIEEDSKLLDKPTPTIEDLMKKHNVDKMHIIKQLNMGVKVESEHTNDKKLAREIALDHLGEDPKYYTKLAKVRLEEDKMELPDIVYHGTKRGNLSNIMRIGLRPQLNKWLYKNKWQGQAPGYPGYVPPTPEEKKQDTVISTTTQFDSALAYAKSGGSTGSSFLGAGPTDKGLVVAFKPLPTDKFSRGLYGGGGEIIFYNTIAPERLKVVYPENVAGKEEKYVQRGQDVNAYNTEKFKKIADINKQLRKVGSKFKVASFRYKSIRPDIFVQYTDKYIEDLRSRGESTIMDDPGVPQQTTLDSDDFKQWLSQELNKSNLKKAELEESMSGYIPNKNEFTVADFKSNCFESMSDFKRWIRSPKTDKRGMPRTLGDHYENLIYAHKNILESSDDLVKKVQDAKILSKKIKHLDQREHVQIKVGNSVSLLSVTTIPADRSSKIEVSGFIKPKEIVNINLDHNDEIDTIEFSDGSRFPEMAEFTTVGGVNITNTMFFIDESSAIKAYTTLWVWLSQLEGKGWSIETYTTEQIHEASGYIPSEKEKNDPRYKTALTVDVKPDTMKKNAKAFGNKISRAGIPPTLRASGKF